MTSTPVEYGTIQSVTEDLAGDELVADVAAGALTLPLGDAVDFDEGGGQLIMDGTEVLSYSSADLDTETLQLPAGPASAYTAETSVQVYPLVVERRALVQLDLDGEAVDARVPHALFDRLPLGTREVGERVSLALDGGEWILTDVLGKEPSIDGTYVDLSGAELPGGTDGLPPSSSPTPTVLGGVGVLHVRWPGIANADPVVYEVHLSTGSGFTPSGATLAAETPGTAITIKALPDGTSLQYGTEEAPQLYYVKLVAKDADPGSAPPSAEASGQLHRVANTEISASYAYVGTLSADAITAGDIDVAVTVSGEVKTSASGQRVVMDSQGLHLFTSAGSPLVDLPTDPAKVVSIKNVDAEVQNLSVKGNLSLESKGTVGAGAGLEMVGGVLAPGAAPTVVLDHEFGTSYAVTIPHTATTGTASVYLYAAAFDASYAYLYTDCQGIQQITKHPLAGGAQVASLDVSAWTGTINGLAIDSATGKLWLLRTGSSGSYSRRVHRVSNALVDEGVSWDIPEFNSSFRFDKGMSIHAGMAYVGQLATSSYTPTVARVDLATGARTIWAASSGYGPGGSGWAGFAAGPFDHGDGVVRFAFASSSYLVHQYVASGTTLVENTNEVWDLGNESSVGAFDPFAWTGSEFRQLKETTANVPLTGATTTASLVWKRFTGITWTSESSQWWASYTWRDSDPAGAAGTSETDQGLRAGFTAKKRWRVKLTSAAIPDLGGTDDPNAVSFYLGRGATDPGRAAMFRQATPADGITTATLTSVAFSGTNPPATNDFPGSTPGYIKAGQGAAARADGKPKTYLDGLGAANVDGLIPPGSVLMWGGATAPTGWQLCDGSALSRSLYPDLAAALYDSATGTYRFGNGDGSTTFNVPDMRMRLPIGADPTTVFGLGQSDGRTSLTSRSDSHSHSHGHGNTLGTGTTGSSHTHDLSISDPNMPTQTNTATGGSATRLSGGSGHTHSGSTALSTGGVGHTHNVTGGVSSGIGLSNTETSAHSWQAFHFIIKL